MNAIAPRIELTTGKLLAHLWRGGAWSYYWTASEAKRKDKPKEAIEKLSTWFKTDQLATYPADFGPYGPRHLYFSVHPTKAPGNQYQRAKKGERETAAINTLFGEFDFKDFAGPAAAVEHVAKLDPPPSVIISSGGGLHCYWLLADPFILCGNDARDRAKRIQYAWVDYVGSDDDAKDLARVLRIPGSKNYKAKYGPDYPTVEIVKADFEQLYSLAELEIICQPAPAPVKKQRDNHISDWTNDLATAADCLKRLAAWRVEQYRPWVEVGMALKSFGSAGLKLWDDWSRSSSKYDPDECDRKWHTFSTDGLGLGSLIRWANEDDPRPYQPAKSKPPQPTGPGPKELERLATRDKYLAEAKQRAGELAKRQTARYQPDTIPFLLAPDEYEKVYQARQTFSSAAAWREFVLFEFPELDAGHEYQLKLTENRERKIAFCGTPFKRLTVTGENRPGRIMCGLCESCKKIARQNLKRALEKEILDDPESCLLVAKVTCKKQRAKLTRRLRENGTRYKVLPVASQGTTEYQILTPSHAAPLLLGEYSELLLANLNDARLDFWLETPEGERQSGDLIPSRRELLKEFSEPDKWERPAGPDTVAIELPGIVCEGELPEVTTELRPTNAGELQRALNDIADQQRRHMLKRGRVILGVINKINHYALNDIPAICEEFNRLNEARRQKKKG